MIKILLIGLGSIGKRHWRILKNLNDWGMFEIKLHHFIDWELADSFGADVAFICNPTFLHIETAIQCAERGMHLFIEKPIDCKLNNLDKLIDIIESKGLTSYVAYPLRHHRQAWTLKTMNMPNLTYFVNNSYLEHWRPYQTYSSDWRKGGGALLECSHEIDLAEYLLGPVEKIDGTFAWKANSLTNAETTAYLRIDHAGGKVSWHGFDILSDKKQRFVKHGATKVDIVPDDQMFLDQTVYFLNNLGNTRIMNNLIDASKLFRKMIEFREGEYESHYYNSGTIRQQGTSQ